MKLLDIKGKDKVGTVINIFALTAKKGGQEMVIAQPQDYHLLVTYNEKIAKMWVKNYAKVGLKLTIKKLKKFSF